ncbi:MAG TPA: hypothetical protein VGO50_05650 [Pyrinomonadaceae bacterium]|jgi:hypothetical protein|nr:hypothetical protein [Pyrinomonadaceae bacterium]
MNNLDLKKIFLYLLIVSVGISVLVGILVVLLGTQEQGGRIFLTSLTITVASFSLFLNGVFFEKLRIKLLPYLGFLTTAVCASLCVSYVWELRFLGELKPLATAFTLLTANFFLISLAFYYEQKREPVVSLLGLLGTGLAVGFIIVGIWELATATALGGKVLAICIALAITCVYLSLILRVSVAKQFNWSLIAVQIVAWTLFATICWTILLYSNPGYELIGRLLIILSILITALTVLIPIFHFISPRAPTSGPGDLQKILEEIDRLKAKLAELEERKRRLENPADAIS